MPLAQRRWLYSFQGVYRPELYLTPVREWILALPSRPDALLEARREWHFEQQVYREQVHGQAADALRHGELATEAAATPRPCSTACLPFAHLAVVPIRSGSGRPLAMAPFQ